MTYTMSRDYDALYEHLCAGGEALGRVQIGQRKYTARIEAFHGFIHIDYHEDEKFSATNWSVRIGMRISGEAFIAECTRLNLEWIAPVDLAGVLEAGDELIGRSCKCVTERGVVHHMMSAGRAEWTEPGKCYYCKDVDAWTTATAKFRKQP